MWLKTQKTHVFSPFWSNKPEANFLRRIEKTHKIDFANMPSRNWFFEGETFVSPEFKQAGKPYKINAEIKQAWFNSLPKTKVLSLKEKIKLWFNPTVPKKEPLRTTNLENHSESFFEKELDKQELESENSDLEEIEEEWIE